MNCDLPASKNSRQHVRWVLDEFLKDEKPGVLAVKGPWGVGKTYAWNEFFGEYKQDCRKYNGYAYVSLFGINSIAELRQSVFAKHEVLPAKKRGWIRKLWGRSRGALRHIDLSGFTHGALKAEVLSEYIQDKLLKNFIICIDDLERKEDSVSAAALLGFITSLREERQCKVVLLFNEAEADKTDLNQSFGEYREKVIDREIVYIPTVEENFQIVFTEGSDSLVPAEHPGYDIDPIFGGERRTALALFQSLEVVNIRVIQKTKDALVYFKLHLATDYPNLYQDFAQQVVKLCCLYYLHEAKFPLEDLLNTSAWETIFDKDDGDPEKEEERAKRKPIQDIAYIPHETDVIIVEFLKRGYVHWEPHIQLLDEAERQHFVTALGAEHSRIWEMFWGNFRASESEFVSAQRGFLNANWETLGLKEVDGAVRFLRELDPNPKFSDLLDQKISQFVQEHADTDLFHFDFHGVDPETVKKIKKKVAQSIEEIPIGEAVERLTRDGGWNSKDFKYLLNRSTEDFFAFLTTTGASRLIAKLRELRLRLLSSDEEEVKAIVGRLDEALRQIAKRSKIDAIRVQRIGLDTTESKEGESASDDEEGEK